MFQKLVLRENLAFFFFFPLSYFKQFLQAVAVSSISSSAIFSGQQDEDTMSSYITIFVVAELEVKVPVPEGWVMN